MAYSDPRASAPVHPLEVSFPERLLTWYDRHRRDLPWRAGPGERADPYHVWLSEIMLQQTTVATVMAYFEKFTALWPTVKALADAPLDDVLTAWAGLGYYARARNLHKCAVEIAHNRQGQFPTDEADLLTLPGVGAYTAAAIASIAFDRRAVVVDGNVERVVSRWYALEQPFPKAKPAIKALTDRLTPATRSRDFPQAMMDLGAGLCTPRAPSCLLCPVSEGCRAFAAGEAALYPKKAPKKPKPTRYGLAYWIVNEAGEVLLTRRPDTGLLGGMMEVPGTGWEDDWPKADTALTGALLDGAVEHTFTHFHLRVRVLVPEQGPDAAFAAVSAIKKGATWAPLEDLNRFA
ncbi:MAG: A/G-specific adenine glycosylase, partial [Alphaproteobacteria bacterium TMED89]